MNRMKESFKYLLSHWFSSLEIDPASFVLHRLPLLFQVVFLFSRCLHLFFFSFLRCLSSQFSGFAVSIQTTSSDSSTAVRLGKSCRCRGSDPSHIVLRLPPTCPFLTSSSFPHPSNITFQPDSFRGADVLRVLAAP